MLEQYCKQVTLLKGPASNLVWFGMVRYGLVWFGFEWFGTWVMSRCFYMLEKQQSYGRFKDIGFGLVWLGLVWSGMVNGYCLDVIPCKI